MPRAKGALDGIAIKSALAISMLFPARAMAAADWAAPATTMLESLEGGLVNIAAPIIGIGIICYGIWAMVTGRIDIIRLGQLIVAGALISFGPGLLRTLLGPGS
ncbi:TrbC/VirB2 family protein [Roseibium algae]|uniref:TrbC/VirB2 family protein n=1 Tax=Roseibium algae TaxID=3123038 RepID=A0ABU8TRV1_9HYPH